MKVKKLGSACLALLGTATITYIGVRYFSSQKITTFLGQQLTPIAGAEVIPNNAIAVSYFATDYELWAELKQLNLSDKQQLLEEQAEVWHDDFTRDINFEYQQDIEPWLGGAMIAMLPRKQKNFNILIILGIKNKFKAKIFFNKLRKELTAKSSETEYRGFYITKVIDNRSRQIHSTLIDNKLIIANEQQIIKQAIDSYQNKTSLITNPQTRLALKQPLNLRSSLAKIYIPNYRKLVQNTFDKKSTLLELPLVEKLRAIQSTTITFKSEAHGLKIRTITKLNSKQTKLKFDTNPRKLLNYLPDETIAMVNGQELNKIWLSLVEQFETNENTSRFLDITRLFLRITANIDLDKDVFGWMDGEFVVGLIKTEIPIIPDLDVGLGALVILETTQSELAHQRITRLETNLAKQLDLNSLKTKIGNKTIIQWQDANSNNIFSYGWLDSHNLLLIIGDSKQKFFNTKQHQTLSNNKFFQTIARELPNKNQGYFYFDIAQILNMAHYLPLEELDDNAKQTISILKSIKGIGTTITMTDEYTKQQDLFILFQED